MSTQQLAASVTRSSGSTETVTSTATWTSSAPAVATVSPGGLVTAVAVGTTTITASYQGVTDTCAVTVADSPEALTVTPATAALDLS